MEISIEETNEIIQELQNIGALDVNFNPTEDEAAYKSQLEEIAVVYKYAKRPDASGIKYQQVEIFVFK